MQLRIYALLCGHATHAGSVEDKRYHQLMRQRVDEILEMQEQSEMVSGSILLKCRSKNRNVYMKETVSNQGDR